LSPAGIEDDPYGIASQKNEMEFDGSNGDDRILKKEISV
jgi:hypothetical protein